MERIHVKELGIAIGLCKTREERSLAGMISSSNKGAGWIWELVDEGLVDEPQAYVLRISSQELMKRVPEAKRIIRVELTKLDPEYCVDLGDGFNMVRPSSQIQQEDVDYYIQILNNFVNLFCEKEKAGLQPWIEMSY